MQFTQYIFKFVLSFTLEALAAMSWSRAASGCKQASCHSRHADYGFLL